MHSSKQSDKSSEKVSGTEGRKEASGHSWGSVYLIEYVFYFCVSKRVFQIYILHIHTLERYSHNPYIICIYIFKMCRYIFQPPVFMGLPGPKSWFSWKLWDVLFVDFKMGHKENNHKIVTLIHKNCHFRIHIFVLYHYTDTLYIIFNA